jgi:hypothetical protein
LRAADPWGERERSPSLLLRCRADSRLYGDRAVDGLPRRPCEAERMFGSVGHAVEMPHTRNHRLARRPANLLIPPTPHHRRRALPWWRSANWLGVSRHTVGSLCVSIYGKFVWPHARMWVRWRVVSGSCRFTSSCRCAVTSWATWPGPGASRGVQSRRSRLVGDQGRVGALERWCRVDVCQRVCCSRVRNAQASCEPGLGLPWSLARRDH